MNIQRHSKTLWDDILLLALEGSSVVLQGVKLVVEVNSV